MEFLTTQIKALPQVLQDLIREYNVHHRKQMSNVCRQLKVIQREQYVCDNLDCGIYLYEFEHIKRDILFHNFKFCCEYCAEIGEDDIRYDYRKG